MKAALKNNFGIIWAPELLPEGWSIVRLKNICVLNYGDSLADEKRNDGDVPVYGSNGIVGNHNSATTLAPCIVVGRKGSYGKVNFVTEPCFPIDTTYWIDSRSTKADLRWLSYVLPQLELDKNSQDSAVPGLSREVAYEKKLPKPPLYEQRLIAAYLDEQTAKIDRLMELRRRQMALLKEQRAALIQQAVTRGLNPNAPMKDSGLPWLGEIPSHWEVKRNKVIFIEIDSRSTDGSEELLTVSHLTGVTPRAQKEDVNMFLAKSNVGYKRVEPGDLAINTMWAWMGALGFSSYRGIVSPSYNVYRFRMPASTDYYNFLFNSPNFIKEIIRYSTGIWESRLRLYPQSFFEIRSPVPPLEEQLNIVNYIEKAIGKTEQVLNSISLQLTLLSEYRASLIHEFVTGQRPVPEPSSQEANAHAL